jgi:hypothetical protein
VILDADHRANLRAELSKYLGWSPSDGAHESLASLYETIDDASFPGAIIPRVRNAEVVFYLVADSGPSWRSLQPLGLAFTGVTLSDFDGRPTPLDDRDAFEAAIARSGISHASRVSARPDDADAGDLAASFLRMRRGLASAPVLPEGISATTGQLLGEFRLSLSVRDRRAAEAVIEALRSEMRLDALNLLFLQVQVDAALEDWAILRARGYFRSLCLSRRPPRVTAALAEAIYRTSIEPLDRSDIPAVDMLAAFRQDVLGMCGDLFVACPPATSPAVAKMFLLGTIASPTPDWGLVDTLQTEESGWKDDDRHSFERLLRLLPARAREDRGRAPTNPEAQLAALRGISKPSVSDAQSALLAASLVQTLDAYHIAIDLVGALPAPERDVLLRPPGVRAMWDELRAHAVDDRVPTGWREFIRLAPSLSFGALRAWAEKGVVEFPIERELINRQDVADLVADLQKSFADAEDVTHQLLPYVVEWVRSDQQWPNPEFRELYEGLIELLLLGSGRTPTLITALGQVLAATLAVGMEAATYTRTTSDLADWLRSALGLGTADAVVDVLEAVATNPAPDDAARQAFWLALAGDLARLWRRLSVGQQSVTSDIAASFDVPGAPAFEMPEPAETPAARDELPARGYLLAIYTLMEGAGLRVQRALERTYPGIRVELSTSHVADPRLNDLAARADLFVVCWASAKHAATLAIRNRRGPDQANLYPRGVGSTSVVREVQEYLAALTH